MKFEKPIILYEYSTSRNKFKEKNKLPGTMKKELIKEKGKICYICKKEFESNSYLEFEHIIPVMVGGHLFDKSNVDLVCVKCHVKKTRIDIKTINMLKKSRIIHGNYHLTSFFPKDKVIKYFKEFKKIIEEIQIKQEIYDFGQNGKEYIQYFDESNRE